VAGSGRATARLRSPLTAFLAVQALILLYAGLGPLLLVWLPAETPGFGALVEYWRGGEVFLLGRHPQPGLLLLLYGLLPVALYGPATFLMGLSFPILQRAVQDEARTSGLKTGLLQAANIAGCVAGSLLAGLVGLQWLGTADTLRALLVLGCAFPLLGLRVGPRPPFALAVASLLALALGLPSGQALWARLHGVAHAERALVAEDASGVVLLSSAEPGRWQVWTNGHHHSNLPFGGVHTLLGALPALLHPRPERVAIVGLGSGDTAWAPSLRSATRELDVFEICGAQRPLLRQLAAREAWPDLSRLLEDPRLRLQVTDGRQALARSPGRYDLVELDPLWPYYAYSGNRLQLGPDAARAGHLPARLPARPHDLARPRAAGLAEPAAGHQRAAARRPGGRPRAPRSRAPGRGARGAGEDGGARGQAGPARQPRPLPARRALVRGATAGPRGAVRAQPSRRR
jgi:hypothetical protein